MDQIIYCCGCGKLVKPRLTTGEEIYPHRYDLRSLPFWKCDSCGNFVGCHHKTKDRTRPLGTIPNEKIRKLRREIHGILDPLWKEFGISRKDIYSRLTRKIGRQYHTAEINTETEANIVATELGLILDEKLQTEAV